jgi:Raf kinase inhibitor-like YbhB/YbcL family protein
MAPPVPRLILAAATALFCVTPAAAQEKLFALSSATFKDGQMMPPKVANSRANDPQNPNCTGENVSPQLSWVNPPPGTRSFAILMYDVDGQFGVGVSHWVAYNIAPTVHELAEGDGTAGRKFTGGSGTRGNANYLGPCPPRGDGPHHYLITVIALDIDPALPPGLTREEFLNAAKGHHLAASSIGGLFARAYE